MRAASRASKRRVVVVAVVAGHQRHAGLFHQRLGRALLPMAAMAAGGGPMKTMPAAAQAWQRLVLAQEAVARVDGLRAGGPGGVEDALASAGSSRAGWRRRCAPPRRRRARGGQGIGVGVDGHGADAQAARGGGHAAGDFAAVGNQDLLEHA
jgi:hypothetical protein